MNLKEVFLGSLDSGVAPVFRSVSHVAQKVAAQDSSDNPYVGRARACVKHLSAIFRNDRARLSSSFYAVLRDVWVEQVSLISREPVEGRFRFPTLAELEAAANLHRRVRDDAEGFDAGIAAFADLLSAARFIRLDWAGHSTDGLRSILEPVYEALRQSDVVLHAAGPGHWKTLYQIGRNSGLSKVESYRQLLTWNESRRVQVDVQANTQFCEVKVESSDHGTVGFLVFPEGETFVRLFRIPSQHLSKLHLGKINKFAYYWTPYDDLQYLDQETQAIIRPDDPNFPY